MSTLSQFLNVDLLAAGVRMATPLTFAALGEVYAERSGVLNIGLEGAMLVGAFAGFWGAHLTGSAWLGALLAMAVGAVMGLILGVFAITLRANQIVVGVALNIFALGVTSFLRTVVFGLNTDPVQVTGFQPVNLGFLSKLPFAGPAFFQHVPLVYVAILLIPISNFILFRTSWGVVIRATGDNPRATDTLGLSVPEVRYISLLVCGALAGLGGAFLSLGQLNLFVENMTSGRGYIALAAVIFGKWNPTGVLLASLLFGFADALQFRIQGLGLPIPFHIPLMLPYILTLVALGGFVGRSRSPLALGRPYQREAR